MSHTESEARAAFCLSPPFAAQFDRDGDGYIYRRAYAGPAIRISAAERDGFVKAFNRVLAWVGLAMFASLIAVVVLTVKFAFESGEQPFFWVVGGTSVVSVAGVTSLWLAWQAPNRALAGRSAVAPPLSRAEARRAAWAKMSWGQAVLAGFLAPFMLSRGLERSPPVASWVWFSLAAASVLCGCAVVVMKLLGRRAVTSPPG